MDLNFLNIKEIILLMHLEKVLQVSAKIRYLRFFL